MDVSDIMEFRVFIEVFSKEIYAFRYDPMLSNFLAEMAAKNGSVYRHFVKCLLRLKIPIE